MKREELTEIERIFISAVTSTPIENISDDRLEQLKHQANDVKYWCIKELQKIEEKETIKIKGWVARDESDNGLDVYTSKPQRRNEDLHMWEIDSAGDWFSIDEKYFPEVQYNTEPIEVMIEIKPLEK